MTAFVICCATVAALAIASYDIPDPEPVMPNMPVERMPLRVKVMFVVGILFVAFCAAIGALRAHDHWINNGKYLDPTTGVHCCNEHDCKVIPQDDLSLYQFNRSGSITTPDGMTFQPNQIHNSEDEHWYRCASRCLFRPQQV